MDELWQEPTRREVEYLRQAVRSDVSELVEQGIEGVEDGEDVEGYYTI